MNKADNNKLKESHSIDFAEFLEVVPPHTEKKIKNFKRRSPDLGVILNLPAIALHCPHAACEDKGTLIHKCIGRDENISGNPGVFVCLYQCPNCEEPYKSYAVKVISYNPSMSNEAVCIKMGEYPNFGPNTPGRLVSLIGPDRELFLKGRRSEIQGLGIGSFAYYRRVIENQKNRLFDEIIKITKILEADSHLIEELENAKSETQFTKSIEAINTALPQTLFINGENPLTLLHGALSEGLHAKSDMECLEIASNVRVVLTALAEKMTNALNSDAELVSAVKGLKQLKNKP